MCVHGLAASADDDVGLCRLNELRSWVKIWRSFWVFQYMRVFLILGHGEGMGQVVASRGRFAAGWYSCIASGASVPCFSPPTVWGSCKFFHYDMLGGLFQYLVSV